MRSPVELRWHEVYYSPVKTSSMEVKVESANFGPKVMFRASCQLAGEDQVTVTMHAGEPEEAVSRLLNVLEMTPAGYSE